MNANTKIIFLDIDGVLNTHKYTVQTKDDEEHAYKFLDRNKIKLLKHIVDTTNARLVLSSTWRNSFAANLEPTDYLSTSLTSALKNEGLELYSKTEHLNDDRYTEIKTWLKNYPEINKFVIIDDNDFDWKDLYPFWIKTSYYIGLTEALVDDVISILI